MLCNSIQYNGTSFPNNSRNTWFPKYSKLFVLTLCKYTHLVRIKFQMKVMVYPQIQLVCVRYETTLLKMTNKTSQRNILWKQKSQYLIQILNIIRPLFLRRAGATAQACSPYLLALLNDSSAALKKEYVIQHIERDQLSQKIKIDVLLFPK